MDDDQTKCIGLSVCGGPCDDSCPVIRNSKNTVQAGFQITEKTLIMIDNLRELSEKNWKVRHRTVEEAIEDCVHICHEYYEQIKAGVLIDAKYPEGK